MEQLEVAFGWLQVMPHMLQLASVFSGVSQPFVSLPSQFAKPALQLMS